MGIMDAFNPEDRVEMKTTVLYQMLREAAKCELLMNAVNCNVAHECIRAMATGKADYTNNDGREGEIIEDLGSSSRYKEKKE